MKPHEHLFLSGHTAMGSISKVLEYLTTHLPSTFDHPLKTFEDCEMLSFLCGTLQIYLEFGNSTDPFAEYIPVFTKSSDSLQQECEYMIAETVSLLKHIRSCQFFPNMNTVESMDKLQKVNMDLISILDQYFNTNTWTNMSWELIVTRVTSKCFELAFIIACHEYQQKWTKIYMYIQYNVVRVKTTLIFTVYSNSRFLNKGRVWFNPSNYNKLQFKFP